MSISHSVGSQNCLEVQNHYRLSSGYSGLLAGKDYIAALFKSCPMGSFNKRCPHTCHKAQETIPIKRSIARGELSG